MQLQRSELLGSLRGDGQPHQCHPPPLHVPPVPGDTHLPRDGLLQVWQGLARCTGCRAPAGHQLGREVAGCRDGAGECLPRVVQHQPGLRPQPLPRRRVCTGRGCVGAPGVSGHRSPSVPARPNALLLVPPPVWVPWEKGHRVARSGSWISSQTWGEEQSRKTIQGAHAGEFLTQLASLCPWSGPHGAHNPSALVAALPPSRCVPTVPGGAPTCRQRQGSTSSSGRL